MDWSAIRHFTEDEFRCRCGCDEATMDELFVRMLDSLRDTYGRPMRVTSGYRCPAHNARVSSTGTDGPHTTGKAADIAVSGQDADRLLELAYQMGFGGKGVNQKGPRNQRFIHLDALTPRLWSY